MGIDIKYLKEIIAVAKESGLNEIEITEGDQSFRFVVDKMNVPEVPTPATQVTPPAPIPQEPVKEVRDDLFKVRSPMVGTSYLSPSPGSQPFVNVGQRVKEGDVICLIEAMKMFNKVRASKNGVVRRILVEDGGAVEFDQALIELDEA